MSFESTGERVMNALSEATIEQVAFVYVEFDKRMQELEIGDDEEVPWPVWEGILVDAGLLIHAYGVGGNA